jgi:hypothetical protein
VSRPWPVRRGEGAVRRHPDHAARRGAWLHARPRRAEFGLGRCTEARATLDGLRRRWPSWESAEGHLLYARTLEGDGCIDEAIAEYHALSAYYAGAEPRVRHGLALRKLGREAEARAVLADVVLRMSRAPKFARKIQAEWISMAEAALRG